MVPTLMIHHSGTWHMSNINDYEYFWTNSPSGEHTPPSEHRGPEWRWQPSCWPRWGPRRRACGRGWCWGRCTTRQCARYTENIVSVNKTLFKPYEWSNSPLLSSIFVYDIPAEVKVLRNVPLEVLNNFLIMKIVATTRISTIMRFKNIWWR